ncbi:MAG: class I SAM-dependent methyltransferase [Deltaproteobacteria bacterium]|nr:class I SAM-dependent methyltransferase [Deltaproteobacteria bacterium]
MRYYPETGIAAPELNWVPSPTFILRRSAIFDVLDRLAPGSVLEMGCGAGALLHELARRGYTGVGVEMSLDARGLAEHILEGVDGMSVIGELPNAAPGSFDYLLSFEVLEHIEDDRAALGHWVDYLRPDGVAVISVPAHRSKWNITDRLAGHYRRYNRDDVRRLIEGAGLEIEQLQTYGWPASWFIERIRLIAYAIRARTRGVDVDAIAVGNADHTKASGVDRAMETRFFSLYASRPGRAALAAATRIQRGFYQSDRGISFLAVARKP